MADEEYARTLFQGPRVGDVLSLTARTVSARLVPLFAIVALCLGPALILDLVLLFLTGRTSAQMSTSHLGGRAWVYLAGGLGVTFLRAILTYVAQGAVVFLTVEHLAGRKAGVGPAMNKAASRLLVVIATAIIESLLIGLGMLLCLVPGILFACMYFVAVPAAVTEKVGPVKALGRSAEMTRGYRTSIFVLLLVVFVLSFMFSWAIGMARVPLAGSADTATEIVSMALGWVVEVVSALVFSVPAAVTYALLRGVRDGLDAESLASVFA